MYMLKSGFQNLWETIVEQEDIKVTFNVDIFSLYRGFDRKCRDGVYRGFDRKCRDGLYRGFDRKYRYGLYRGFDRKCRYGLYRRFERKCRDGLYRGFDRKCRDGLYRGFDRKCRNCLYRGFDRKCRYGLYRGFDRGCRDGAWLYKREGHRQPSWEYFDFIIWSPEMKTSICRWRDQIPLERQLLTATNHVYFTTSIVDSENETRGYYPFDIWMDNVGREIQYSVFAQHDSYAEMRPHYKGVLYQNNSLPTGNDGKSRRTNIVYQFGNKATTKQHLKTILIKHFEKLGGTDIKVIKMKTWRYFPHYSPAHMEQGYLWRILEMQGKYGMWYIGSSVSFESVTSVVEYNKLLLRNMIMPKKRIKHFRLS